MSTKEEQLKGIFRSLDCNQDGGLSLFELKNAFNGAGIHFPIHKAYQALCLADRNVDGKLGEDEIDELVKYVTKQG